jgi:hypothetical protein
VRESAEVRWKRSKKEVTAMKLSKWNVLWGVLMVVAGGLLLPEALGVLAVGGRIWPVLFGAAGVAFLYVFFASRENWWAAIPAIDVIQQDAGLVTRAELPGVRPEDVDITVQDGF